MHGSKPAMVLDLLTGQYTICKRFSRPRLWLVTIAIEGVDYVDDEVRHETDLMPQKPIRAAELAALAVDHCQGDLAAFQVIRDARLKLYRLTQKQHNELKTNGVEVIHGSN